MSDKKFDYFEKSEALEAILQKLQSDDLPLDEAIVLHKEGQAIAQSIEQYLQEAEVVIKKQIIEE